MTNTYAKSFSQYRHNVSKYPSSGTILHRVIEWYVIMERNKLEVETKTAIGNMCLDIFGKGWEYFEIANLSTSD